MQKNSFPIAVKYASYAGLMFFSFLVEKSLKSDDQHFAQQDREFIAGRCQVGTFSWFLFGVLLILAGGGYIFESGLFQSFAFVLLGALLLIQIGGAILITLNIPFTSSKFGMTREQSIQLLKLFIPGFPEKARFAQQDFTKPNRWLKESQIWWFMIVFLLLVFPIWELGAIIFGCLLLRIGFLFGGKDVVVPELKLVLHRSYLKYVEELFLIPYVMLYSWKKRENGFNLSLLQDYQLKSQALNFFSSWIWIFIFGFFLLLIAIFGRWSGMWWKIIPLLWWIVRWGLIKSL